MAHNREEQAKNPSRQNIREESERTPNKTNTGRQTNQPQRGKNK